MNSIILYVIRHGETICNEQKLYCGKSNVSLSERGKTNLLTLKKSAKYPICTLNYTSGAIRANETFQILYNDLEFQEKKDFFEYDFGDFEMKSYDMLKHDKNYIEWIMDKTNRVKCPNGESKEEFRIRIKKAINSLIDEVREGEALLLCHGGTIGTLLEIFSDTEKDFYALQPKCGRGYKLKVVKAKENIIIDIIEEI